MKKMRRPRSCSGANATGSSNKTPSLSSLEHGNSSSGSSRKARGTTSSSSRRNRTSGDVATKSKSNKKGKSQTRRKLQEDEQAPPPFVDQYPTQQISNSVQHHHQQLENKGVSLSSSTSGDQSYDLDDDTNKHEHEHPSGLKYDELSITSFYSDADGIVPVVNNNASTVLNNEISTTQQQHSSLPLTPAAPQQNLLGSSSRTHGKAQHHPWVEESPLPTTRSKQYYDHQYNYQSHITSKSSKKKKGMKKLISSKGTRGNSKTRKGSGSDGLGGGSNRNNSSISRVYGTGGVIYEQAEGNYGEGMNNDSSSTMNDDDDDSSDDEYTAKKSYRVKGGGHESNHHSSRKHSSGDDFANSFKAPTVVQGVTALSAAAITGGILLGPFGVLLGAGALVAAAGYQSLPEEQRQQIQIDAQERIRETYEFGEKLTDRLGNSCAVAFEKTGDVIGCQGAETGTESQQASSTRFGVLVKPTMGPYGESDDGRYNSTHDMDNKMSSSQPQDPQHVENNVSRITPEKCAKTDISNSIEQQNGSNNHHLSPAITNTATTGPATLATQKSKGFTTSDQSDQNMFKLLASSRRTPRPALPVSQIHVLEPKFRPRAWLDLMCDPYSSADDKNEAMEEILILAKDKHHGRMFLEEGILDALLSILNRFFKLHEKIVQMTGECEDPTQTNKKAPRQEMNELVRLHQLSLLAANLCVALGKAHCAVVHTEGDLLLMSSYKQGAVPEGRQLAQMLYEIPHRLVITSNEFDSLNNNAAVNGGRRTYRRSDDVSQNALRYRVKEMSLEEAESLAKQIKDLTEGYYDPVHLCSNKR